MQQDKQDRRVIKTKKAIRQAFVKLLSIKEFNKITIKDIADTADVDRKTVYNYYSGIYKIRDEVENEFLELWNDAEKEFSLEKITNPLDYFLILTNILNRNIELYGYLMKFSSNSQALTKLKTVLTDKLAQTIKVDTKFTNCNAEVCAEFIASGMLSAYQQWFNSNRTMPLEELSQTVGKLVVYGITAFTQNKE